MHAALHHLIQLQQLETDADLRRRRLAELPHLSAALDERLAERLRIRDEARQALSDNQAARRAIEKDLAVVQGRLTKFKDQLMEVKTNKEYTAMQHEIATAQDGVRTLEDQMLELLLAADDLNAAVGAAERELAGEQTAVVREREAFETERVRIEAELGDLARNREAVERHMPGDLVALFVDVARKRRGLAVAEARDGHCAACHVRLRPQLVLDLRRAERVVQCESCSRILYAPTPQQPAAPPA